MNLSNDERIFLQRGCRTKNASERKIIADLEREGWTVIKRGWPDLAAFRKGDKTRFIEVKPPGTAQMKAQQAVMAKLLARFGITVELLRPSRSLSGALDARTVSGGIKPPRDHKDAL